MYVRDRCDVRSPDIRFQISWTEPDSLGATVSDVTVFCSNQQSAAPKRASSSSPDESETNSTPETQRIRLMKRERRRRDAEIIITTGRSRDSSGYELGAHVSSGRTLRSLLHLVLTPPPFVFIRPKCHAGRMNNRRRALMTVRRGSVCVSVVRRLLYKSLRSDDSFAHRRCLSSLFRSAREWVRIR